MSVHYSFKIFHLWPLNMCPMVEVTEVSTSSSQWLICGQWQMKGPNSPIFSRLSFVFPSCSSPVSPLLSYLSNNAICRPPVAFTQCLSPHASPLPCPPSLFLPMDDTGSPCSDFTLSSWHPLKWRWALGPRWPDSTLALGPLNANKDRLWIIDTNTTNEETLSQLFYWHTHTNAHVRTHSHSFIDINYCSSCWCPTFKNSYSQRSVHFLQTWCVFTRLIQGPTGSHSSFYDKSSSFCTINVCSTSVSVGVTAYIHCCCRCHISVSTVKVGFLCTFSRELPYVR